MNLFIIGAGNTGLALAGLAQAQGDCVRVLTNDAVLSTFYRQHALIITGIFESHFKIQVGTDYQASSDWADLIVVTADAQPDVLEQLRVTVTPGQSILLLNWAGVDGLDLKALGTGLIREHLLTVGQVPSLPLSVDVLAPGQLAIGLKQTTVRYRRVGVSPTSYMFLTSIFKEVRERVATLTVSATQNSGWLTRWHEWCHRKAKSNFSSILTRK